MQKCRVLETNIIYIQGMHHENRGDRHIENLHKFCTTYTAKWQHLQLKILTLSH